jgi:hypothetical protein
MLVSIEIWQLGGILPRAALPPQLERIQACRKTKSLIGDREGLTRERSYANKQFS